MDHILLIDDEDSIIDSLYKFLVRMGYAVKVAHSGAEGINAFNSCSNIKMVITDDWLSDGGFLAKPHSLTQFCQGSRNMIEDEPLLQKQFQKCR